MKITFTQCMEKNACRTGLLKARRHLGVDFPRDKPVALASLVEVIGIPDTLWILQNVLGARAVCVEFAIWNAEQVLHVFEEKYPDDKRPRGAIEAAKAGNSTREIRRNADAAADADADA